MTTNKKSAAALIFTGILLVTLGVVGGYFVAKQQVVVLPDEADAPPADGNSTIVELSETTMSNMNLVTGSFKLEDFYQNISIPAEVVERLPIGRQHITAPVSSLVKSVLVSPGQSVRPGQPLFKLEIVDEDLSSSQVEFLAAATEIEILEDKMNRLKPLAESGAIKRSRLLDIELEIKKWRSRKTALAQELQVRGMTAAQIESLLKTGNLAQEVLVVCPSLGQTTELGTATELTDYEFFTVESIDKLGGDTAKRGEHLCQLTYHGELLIKGLAFESDIEKITNRSGDGLFTAEFGERPDTIRREGLKLNSIDNHVNDESQTYSIYVALTNEIAGKNTDTEGREYTHWRFKPGQRAHLEFPIQKWEQQVVVPLEALVREGPETFVFQKMNHAHETPEGTIWEFIKTPVKVLFENQRQAVLQRTSSLDIDEKFALNLAFKLNLTLKQAASGGGGHGHDH